MFDNLSLTKINRLLTKIFFHLNTFQLIPQNIREYKIKKNISTKWVMVINFLFLIENFIPSLGTAATFHF